ncbi:MAG: hypothetical protein ACREGR_02080, partial [Minisyncoccia bacterium]
MRTLDDIIPPSRRTQIDTPPSNQPPSAPPPMRMRPARPHFPYATALIALAVIVVAVAALFYFSKAEVALTPNQSSVAAAGSYTATVSGTLPFEVISTELSATQSVASSGTQNVNSVAQGTIAISNASAKAVTLVSTTRFETPTGLVFRIHAAVSIAAGGTKNATVYADQPGAGYNIAPTSFTVPGLANTAQFNQITAKSSVSMTGGASGTVPVVDPSIAAGAENSLAASLAPQLTKAIASKVPAGYVLLQGAATTTFVAIAPLAASSTGMALVGEQGTVSAVVFPDAALAAAIATANESPYDGEPATVQNPSDLTLT